MAGYAQRMATRAPLASLLLAGVGCAAQPGLPEFQAVTLNVQGSDTILDPVTGPALAREIEELGPQVAALEECVSCDTLLDMLPVRYALVPGEDTPIGILYDTTMWGLSDYGTIVLGGNDDGWGRREARWAELSLSETGAPLFVYSTHWCVSIRNPDDPCDVDKQLEYGQAILDHIATHDAPTILGGDFNVFDGFENGPVVEFLVANGLVDTLREITDEPVVTYEGSPSFPPGRIDYLFTTAPVVVSAASVALESASDHRPVSAMVTFPPH